MCSRLLGLGVQRVDFEPLLDLRTALLGCDDAVADRRARAVPEACRAFSFMARSVCLPFSHAVTATAANVADGTVLPALLHGRETRVWGDQAYRGQRAAIRRTASRARDFTNRRYRLRGIMDAVERAKNRTKSKVRAKVEHPIGVIKRVFGFTKVRYRGLRKNTHRLIVTGALANLFMARRQLLRFREA